MNTVDQRERGNIWDEAHIVAAQVRLQLAGKDFERGTLSNTVRTYESEDLTGTGSGKTMELEGVGGVTMSDLRLKVGGQVDDSDSFKWTSRSCLVGRLTCRAKNALLNTNATTNTQKLGNEGDFVGRLHFDT